jgi:hypothetical protein
MTQVLADNPWEDLVISILSVNNWSLDHTYRLVDGLRKEGLFDPQHLMEWDHKDIAKHLKAAGCNRGLFMTNLFALRLANLGTLIDRRGVEHCAKIISSTDTTAIEELLLPVNGIGPRVIANFCTLRDITRR